MKATLHLSLLFLFLAPAWLGSQNLLTRQEPLPCLNKKFSLAVHFTQDRDGLIEVELDSVFASVDSLNKLFEPICVSFEICSVDTIANWQFNGIDSIAEWDELLVLHQLPNRINLFIIRSSAPFGNECGFGTQDGILMEERKGVAVLAMCMNPSQKFLPHHMGHFFGLLNTHEEEGVELVNGDNCETNGDRICDTPADPYILGQDPFLFGYISADIPCRFTYTVRRDTNGDWYVPDVGNIMSNYPDFCRCGFTYEQYLRMATNCRNAPFDLW